MFRKRDMQNQDENGKRLRSLPRHFDITLLELFDCILRTRNLSKAGEELGLSQPAVSRALGRLRELYGDPLFIRRPRGVMPTPLAESLSNQIKSALNALRETFHRPVFDPQVDERTFRIAMSDIGERLFLPDLMSYVSKNAHGVTIDAVTSQASLEEELGSGRIDLAVGYFGTMSKQLHQRRLFREEFVYIARKKHPAVTEGLSKAQLREIGHVVGGPVGMEHAAAVQKVLAGPRVRARVALRLHSFLCVAPVVASSDLIGVVPSNLAKIVAGHIPLQVLDAPIQFPSFDVTMAWHQRYNTDPGNAWLRATFLALFESGVRINS